MKRTLFGVVLCAAAVTLSAQSLLAVPSQTHPSSAMQEVHTRLTEIGIGIGRLEQAAWIRGGDSRPDRQISLQQTPQRRFEKVRGASAPHQEELAQLKRELRYLEMAAERLAGPVGQWPKVEIQRLVWEANRLQMRVGQERSRIVKLGAEVSPADSLHLPDTFRRQGLPTVGADAVTVGLTQNLVGTGAIGGTVTEEGTGTLLADIYLEVFDESGAWVGGASSDVLGVYQFTELSAGTYYVKTWQTGSGRQDDDEFTRRSRLSWAKLIRRVYEVDPLLCPFCGAEMKILAFIVDFGAAKAKAKSLELPPQEPEPLAHAPPGALELIAESA